MASEVQVAINHAIFEALEEAEAVQVRLRLRLRHMPVDKLS